MAVLGENLEVLSQKVSNLELFVVHNLHAHRVRSETIHSRTEMCKRRNMGQHSNPLSVAPLVRRRYQTEVFRFGALRRCRASDDLLFEELS